MLNAIALAAALASPSPAPVGYVPQMNVAITESISHSPSFGERCDKVARPLKYAAQAYDSMNTARIMPIRQVPEIGPVASKFGRRDPFVAFISDTVLDVVADALTRHSPLLRCGTDTYLAHGAIYGALYTNGWRP